jgi:hypothetical protein
LENPEENDPRTYMKRAKQAVKADNDEHVRLHRKSKALIQLFKREEQA